MTETLEQELAKWLRYRDVQIVSGMEIEVSISREEKFIEALKKKAEDGCVEAIMALREIAPPRAHAPQPTKEQLENLMVKFLEDYKVLRDNLDEKLCHLQERVKEQVFDERDEVIKLVTNSGLEYSNDCLGS